MKHLDLFSGIGGFALAAEMVWDEVEHIFCDNEPFAQAVLKKHWPNSFIHGDIRRLTTHAQYGHELEGGELQTRRLASFIGDTDILTGGFPCQPFSQAGRRLGTADDRHLWPEMLRVIREFHPRWVVGENVGGLVTWNDGMVLEQVHTDLESEDYEVQAFIIPAVSLNAPHRRDRVWIVAHAIGSNARRTPRRVRGTKAKERVQERDEVGKFSESSEAQNASHPKSPERPSKRRATWDSGSFFGRAGWERNWIEVATRLCRVDDGIPRRLDRNPRLKALGNAIVPQVAAEIFKAIKASE